MVSTRDSFDEQEVLTYLETLSQVQGELLGLLVAKREAISTGEVEQLAELGVREVEVQDKMAQLQVRRSEILSNANDDGITCETLEDLVGSANSADSAVLGHEVKEAKQRMRLLQHETLTNWVVEQTSLLHVSRLLEIIACGGRLQPTYGKGGIPQNRGTLVDREV